MKSSIKFSKMATIFILIGINMQIQAEWENLSTEERLERLERILQTQTATIERLRSELKELRGKLELQAHTLSAITNRNPSATNEVTEISEQQTTPISSLPEDATETTPLVPAGATVTADNKPANVGSESEIDMYNQSFEKLKAGKYAEAITGFNAQLVAYPHGQYASNAQYWLGETYYVTRDFDAAMSAFNQVLQQHPKSNKVAGATLKLGFIYHERSQTTKAVEMLEQVIANFPNSTEATLAQHRLKLLVQQ